RDPSSGALMTALRAFVTVGLAAFWVLLFAPPMFQTPPSSSTGVHLIFTGSPIQANVVRVNPGSPAYRAGLRTGAVLGCLSVRDYALLINPSLGLQQAYRPGTAISTCVHQSGTSRVVRFFAQSGPPVENSYGSNPLSALRVGVVVLFFLVGIALVMARPSLMTWVFYAYCLASAPSLSAQENWSVLPAWQYAVAAGLTSFGTQIAVALLLLFSVLVPSDRIPSGWRRIAFFCGATIALADIIFESASVFYTGFTVSYTLVNGVDELLTALTVLVVIARLATMTRMERGRFGWAAVAIIFGVVANDLRNVLSNGSSLPLSIVAGDLTVVMPLCLMYAILKRHVIDVRFVISRTVVYAVVTTLIVGVIGFVDWMTSAYLRQVRLEMAIEALVTIALAFALHRAYGWIERVVDFVLFRRKHDAETYLDRMAKTLFRAKREETIDRALVHAPYEKLDLTVAALFRATDSSFVISAAAGWDRFAAMSFDSEHELIRFLTTERSKLQIRDLRTHVADEFEGNGAAPAVAIPLFESDDLVAFAVYGIHRDGTKLDPDEIDTLERLCETAAQAYTGIELTRYRVVAKLVPAG
ncbi:MAG: hypothetical protein M3R44_06695, partial [Candidatus Eremiobacteraeota bacterium]|nr:hypothetical protein [Candidatus Eremiobacteraeota bacterium]